MARFGGAREHTVLYFSFRISLRMLARFRYPLSKFFNYSACSLKGRPVVAAFVVVVAARLVSIVTALSVVVTLAWVGSRARVLSLARVRVCVGVHRVGHASVHVVVVIGHCLLE